MRVFHLLHSNSHYPKQTLWIAVLALSGVSSGLSQTVNQKSFWNNATVPGTVEDTDTGSVNLGVQFYADVPGTVTAVRFYKGANNTGTHVGNVWSSTGTKLAEVTFSGESASGWQQANFSSPVSITANTRYVISYLAPRGRYAANQSYSWSSVSAAPLYVSSSTPGVYTYASGSSFPKSVWNASNYWVDLVFVPAGTPPVTTTYSISGKVTGSAAKVTLSGTASASTTTDASGNYSFASLPNGSYVVAPSQSGYTFTPSTASVAVSGGSKTGINFIATAVPVVPPPVQPPVSHSVTLTWTPSTSPSISGYHVYRGTVSGGPYTKMTSSPVSSTSYLDTSVASGQTYYYVATTVQSTTESSYSAPVAAVVPTP
jgi:hypothetical protein